MKDTFDVHAWNQKRYLAEGLSDRISKIYILYTEQGKLYSVKVEDADGKRLGKLQQDDTNELLKMLGIEDEIPFRISFGDEKVLDSIVKQLQDRGIDASWDDVMDVSEGKVEENEMDSLGDELAKAIEDTLEDKQDELNEVVDPISILSYILAGTTLTNILAKWVGKLAKKYNFGKGEAAAKKIYDFTHKLEGDFKKPIERVVGLFSKDPKTKKVITDSLFALLILSLGVQAGGGAVESISKGNVTSGTISSLKAALKGKDLSALIKDIVGTVA